MVYVIGCTGTWDWNRLKLEFHQKFYPMHLVHPDWNYIYIFWPREEESIAQAWGMLKSMLYSCPIMSSQEKLLFKNFMPGFLIMIDPCSILLVLVPI